MNHEFCINCGHKAQFSITKPSFCPSCGVHFNKSVNASIASKPAQNNEDDEPEYTGAKFDMNKLRQSVAAQMTDHNKVSLDDLWKDPQKSEYRPRQASSDPEGTALIKQVMSECKSKKEPTEING